MEIPGAGRALRFLEGGLRLVVALQLEESHSHQDADLILIARGDMALATEIRSDCAGLGEVMAARDRFLDGHLAASTLVTVPALARPEWKMEIAVVAAA